MPDVKFTDLRAAFKNLTQILYLARDDHICRICAAFYDDDAAVDFVLREQQGGLRRGIYARIIAVKAQDDANLAAF